MPNSNTIPFHVNSLFVSAKHNNAKPADILAPNDFSRLPYFKDGKIENRFNPFLGYVPTNLKENTVPLEPGVHLHFVLPEALLRAFPNSNDYPPAPNRWLVQRKRGSQKWIVQSDYLYEASTNTNHTTVLLSLNNLAKDNNDIKTVFKKGDIETTIPFRYAGRVLSRNKNITKDENRWTTYYNKPLTALGYGDFYFSVFYPNCKNVFGFHDVGGRENDEYEVYGWWEDITDTINWDHISWEQLNSYLKDFYGENGLNSIKEEELSISPNGNNKQIDYILKSQKSEAPTIKHPSYDNIQKDSTTQFQITLGNTPSETIATSVVESLPSSSTQGKDDLKKLIEAILLDFEDDTVDAEQKYKIETHLNGFVSEPGYETFQIDYDYKEIQKGEEEKQQQYTPTQMYDLIKENSSINESLKKLSTQVNQLNNKKTILDKSLEAIKIGKQNVFSLWFKSQLNQTNKKINIDEIANLKEDKFSDTDFQILLTAELARLFKLERETYPCHQRLLQIKEPNSTEVSELEHPKAYIKRLKTYYETIQGFPHASHLQEEAKDELKELQKALEKLSTVYTKLSSLDADSIPGLSEISEVIKTFNRTFYKTKDHFAQLKEVQPFDLVLDTNIQTKIDALTNTANGIGTNADLEGFFKNLGSWLTNDSIENIKKITEHTKEWNFFTTKEENALQDHEDFFLGVATRDIEIIVRHFLICVKGVINSIKNSSEVTNKRTQYILESLDLQIQELHNILPTSDTKEVIHDNRTTTTFDTYVNVIQQFEEYFNISYNRLKDIINWKSTNQNYINKGNSGFVEANFSSVFNPINNLYNKLWSTQEELDQIKTELPILKKGIKQYSDDCKSKEESSREELEDKRKSVGDSGWEFGNLAKTWKDNLPYKKNQDEYYYYKNDYKCLCKDDEQPCACLNNNYKNKNLGEAIKQNIEDTENDKGKVKPQRVSRGIEGYYTLLNKISTNDHIPTEDIDSEIETIEKLQQERIKIKQERFNKKKECENIQRQINKSKNGSHSDRERERDEEVKSKDLELLRASNDVYDKIKDYDDTVEKLYKTLIDELKEIKAKNLSIEGKKQEKATKKEEETSTLNEIAEKEEGVDSTSIFSIPENNYQYQYQDIYNLEFVKNILDSRYTDTPIAIFDFIKAEFSKLFQGNDTVKGIKEYTEVFNNIKTLLHQKTEPLKEFLAQLQEVYYRINRLKNIHLKYEYIKDLAQEQDDILKAVEYNPELPSTTSINDIALAISLRKHRLYRLSSDAIDALNGTTEYKVCQEEVEKALENWYNNGNDYAHNTQLSSETILSEEKINNLYKAILHPSGTKNKDLKTILNEWKAKEATQKTFIENHVEILINEQKTAVNPNGYELSALEEYCLQQITVESTLQTLNQQIAALVKAETKKELSLIDFRITSKQGPRYYKPSNKYILFQRGIETENNVFMPAMFYWNVGYQSCLTGNYDKNAIDTFSFQSEYPDYDSSTALNGTKHSYFGKTMMADYSVDKLLFGLQEAQNKDGYSETLKSLIKTAYEKVKASAYSLQPFDGFNDASLTLYPQAKLPVHQVRRINRRGKDHLLTITKATNIIAQNYIDKSPLATGAFSPLQAGKLTLEKVAFYDSFGIKNSKLSNLTNVLIAEQLKNTADENTALLKPRVVVPSRIQARWFSAQEGNEESSTIHSSSPIGGWVVVNNINKSLMIYDVDGKSIGSLIVQTSQGQSQVAFLPSFTQTKTSVESITNEYLQSFVKYFLGDTQEKIETLQTFISIINKSLEGTDTSDVIANTEVAIFTARPVALVRLKLNFEIKSRFDQTSKLGYPHSFFKEEYNLNGKGGNTPYSIDYNTKNIEKVQFPIRLGVANTFKDGLIGYWRQADQDYHTEKPILESEYFYAPHVNGIKNTAKIIMDEQSAKTQGLLIHQSLADEATYVNLLFDPRAKLNIVSGILPVKTIDIPTKIYSEALQSLEIAFLNTAIITPRHDKISGNNIQIPVMETNSFQWEWKFYSSTNKLETLTEQPILSKAALQMVIEKVYPNDDLTTIKRILGLGTTLIEDVTNDVWDLLIDKEQIIDVKETIEGVWQDGESSTMEEAMKNTEPIGVIYMNIKETIRGYIRGLLPTHTEAKEVGRQEIREGWLKIINADIQKV